MTTTKTRRKAATKAAVTKSSTTPAGGMVELFDHICQDRRGLCSHRAAMERIADHAAELVAVLDGAGVKFRAPSRAPSQVGASILAAWVMVTTGPRDSDADFAVIASGVVDGVKHALSSNTPCSPIARAILDQGAAARDGAR